MSFAAPLLCTILPFLPSPHSSGATLVHEALESRRQRSAASASSAFSALTSHTRSPRKHTEARVIRLHNILYIPATSTSFKFASRIMSQLLYSKAYIYTKRRLLFGVSETLHCVIHSATERRNRTIHKKTPDVCISHQNGTCIGFSGDLWHLGSQHRT